MWVRLHSGGSAFRFTPAQNDIDSLRDAIKAEWEANKSDSVGATAVWWLCLLSQTHHEQHRLPQGCHQGEVGSQR
jgi:hypothetical protein